MYCFPLAGFAIYLSDQHQNLPTEHRNSNETGRPFSGVSSTGMTTACGYSPFAIACALGVTLALFVASVVLSSRKLKPGMPVVCSCSLAISAACHPELDESVAVKPLLWGAVAHEENEKPGH